MSRGDHESSSSLSTELPVGGGDQTTTATSHNHTEANVKPTVTMHNNNINEKDELVTVTPTTATAAISTHVNVATTNTNTSKGDTIEVNEMTDTTENTTASSNSPTNIGTTTGSTATTNSKNSPTNKAHGKHGKISFGTVHVREHRMTLGSHPEVQNGVPIELSWVKQQSFLYDTIDEFEQSKDPVGTAAQQQQGSDTENESSSELLASVPVVAPNSVRRIPAAERAEIAQLYHSRDSILRITQEVQTIQESRNHSRADKAAQKVIVQLHKQPHATITSNKETADDVLLAHLDKKKQEAASSPKNKQNQQDLTIKKKKKWWFIC